MGTTARQDGEFIEQVISSTLLEDAMEWIGSKMSPEDVFSDTALERWAEGNGFVKE